jgi:hypothetical protein
MAITLVLLGVFTLFILVKHNDPHETMLKNSARRVKQARARSYFLYDITGNQE